MTNLSRFVFFNIFKMDFDTYHMVIIAVFSDMDAVNSDIFVIQAPSLKNPP